MLRFFASISYDNLSERKPKVIQMNKNALKVEAISSSLKKMKETFASL